MEFLGYDAQGTDGSDLSQMLARYRYQGRTVSIPATTPEVDIESAVFAALGIDLDEQQERAALGRPQLTALLAQIETRQTEIAADLLLLPTANATQQRQIVGRLLTAQDAILTVLARMGKALSRLV